jgi:hypothetical protein
MSFELVDTVLKGGPREIGDKLVLIAVASFLNSKTGRCDPSVAAIAERASMTERGARAVLRRLEAEGWLFIQTGGGCSKRSTYRINTEACSGYAEENPEQRSPISDRKPGTSRTETRNATHENPEHRSENPEPRSPEPRRTKKENQEGEPTTRKRAGEGAQPPASDPLVSDATDADRMFAVIFGRWLKRSGEREARRAFMRALADGADPEAIARGAAAYLADRRRDRRGPAAVIQFTTPMARWLDDRAWETWASLPGAEQQAAASEVAEREAMKARMREREDRRRAMPF